MSEITGISSMATQALLADLANAYATQHGERVAIESVGGVEAAKRVEAGEPFDVVLLARDAIDRLLAGPRLVAGSVVDFARSGVAMAVRAGAPRPDIASEDGVRRAVLTARTIGTSTGPSGVELGRLFERWGIAGELEGRLVVARPGTPVGSLVARGEVELGFQQLSELARLPGIDVLGMLPESIRIVTTFSAAVARASTRPAAGSAFLAFMVSPELVDTKRRHGLEPA